jgi:hypothetical protein
MRAGGDRMMDLREIAARARRGDVEAVRLLHFGDGTQRESDPAWAALCAVAGPRFRDAADTWTPQPRAVPPGGIDFHRLHCLALDRLPELLALLLPEGQEGGTAAGAWAWHGWHPLRPELVQVCLLGGTWTEPNTGRSGRDLVSLYGHMFGVGNGRAARMLAEWLGAEVRAYA